MVDSHDALFPSIAAEARRAVPTRPEAALFRLKATLLRIRRRWRDATVDVPLQRHPVGTSLIDAPVIAQSRSPLWSAGSDPQEWALTAGKVQNLRVALRGLDGIEIPAGAVFSFWRQIGRATRRRGFVAGRELREGCMISTVGGGLCQLSNALYDTALGAGFEIVERHAHSRVVPGSRAVQGRDATVFWNYVDLRFRSRHAFRIEARMTDVDLDIRFRGIGGADETQTPPSSAPQSTVHDCVSCGQVSCFRHVPRPGLSPAHRAAWLIDACWPEYAAVFQEQAGPADTLFLPMRGPLARRYAWPASPGREVRATRVALARAIASRRQSAQGRAIQTLALTYDRRLAETYARHLPYIATHLVVSQSLLPHLWQLGCLQGRTFDVLMERWPLAELQARLDDALRAHPGSPTLGDFRAPPDIVDAEASALAAADRLYTPHAGLAGLLGEQAVLLPWVQPRSVTRRVPGGRTLLFPASPLGRKGVYALREALQGLDVDLLVAGRAREDTSRFWGDIAVRTLDGPAWPDRLAGVVLPAIIEHQPRALLRAQAVGIPVIASTACGLMQQPGTTLVDHDDVAALRAAIVACLESSALDT
ncbi:VanW family protein [Reyranella sp. CPCC 100927]|uniref:VanW family protein n=1 Tax=Reyranella sp. CPCC 100927 TaxID=2599616 RepID=UPI0011B495FD|nr:VanW family protein [Reyranella sp. CPCC 100927]TWT02680.1 vanw family protein [Reyranella sp. CPCC 100927]